MENYKEKYLKYKNKYLELKNKENYKNKSGGLIGKIESLDLDLVKSEDEVPDIIKDYVKMITIPNTEVIRVGSSMNKIQPYFSDVDVMNIIYRKVSSSDIIKLFISELKKIILDISNNPYVFFSDFKAGGVHWSLDQIEVQTNDQLTLEIACGIKDVIKLDIIAPYNGRYLEISTFYVLKSVNEYINIESNYFENFQKSLQNDIAHFQNSKPFKAIKRVWSLSRISRDFDTLNLLQELIKSNIALLAQINADVETIILLVEHKSKYDIDFILKELDGFKERLSTVLDIKLDYEKIDIMVDNIKLLFKFENLNEQEMNIIGSLKKFHKYLNNFINKETIDYLNSIQYKFPIEKSEKNISTESEVETINSDIPEMF